MVSCFFEEIISRAVLSEYTLCILQYMGLLCLVNSNVSKYLKNSRALIAQTRTRGNCIEFCKQKGFGFGKCHNT